MSGVSQTHPVGWFRTITRPRSHLIATLAMLVVFIGGFWLGTAFSEYRMWFYGPAVVAILWWYLMMMRSYSRARRGR
ncbi:hypothetical protein J2Y69_000265 [Microbacterium resistens]|uniref:Uncharacterized protein n=1 Tax=Microbacterium resistens TaxID=156977 RepID=A0ABU1S8V3_9MICO|nr:hypothetical protein [Microbacterium resistens]